MLRRMWDMLVKVVKSLFASAPDPREARRSPGGYEELLARIAGAQSRIQTILAHLDDGVASSRREAAGLFDEARCLVEGGRDDAARVVLHRRQAVLDRVRVLEGQLARLTLEDQALANASERIESEIAIRSARQNLSAARYVSAEARARVTEALTDVSGEFSDLLAELKDADERADHMEARADALDELVEVGVLSPQHSLPQLASDESHPNEVETLLVQMKQEATVRPVDAHQR